jgi:hypothetical protein
MMIPWRVAKLEVLPGYCLNVTFADGLSGVIDMSNRSFHGVFEPLKDVKFFAQAAIVDGAVTWPNGVDVAPDGMYQTILAQQKSAA